MKKQLRFIHNQGFTLVEVIVAISIIGILSGGVVLVAVPKILERSHAHQTLQHFKQIELAWRLWKTDSGQNYPDEFTFPTTSEGCANVNTAPKTSATYPYTEKYLTKIPINPVTKREYTYDYSSGGQPAAESVGGGVNIELWYCNALEKSKIENIFQILDKDVDRSDGKNRGKIRVEELASTRGHLHYNIANTNTDP